jgi:hypothetical protein
VAETITAAGVLAAIPASRIAAEIVHHHVQHDGLAGPRQRRPVEILLGAVSGGKNDGAIDAAERCRNARGGERGEPGGHAGNDAKRYAGPRQRHGLFAAAAEYERIAALEPQHAMARARKRDQALADIGLQRRRLAAAFAGEFESGLGSGQGQHALVDQGIVDDNIGLREPGERIEGEQTRVARSGAGEPDMSRRKDRNSGPPRCQGIPCGHNGLTRW